MSIARHHNEWLSLIEVSGPFLSMPVLLRTFPQGLDAIDREGLAELRSAYEEWLNDQNGLKPNPAIHTVWVRYVLEHVLNIEKSSLLEGPSIPATLTAFVAEQGETLRPDLVISAHPLPMGEGRGEGVRLLIQTYPLKQGLEKSMQGRHWKASPAMRMLELLRATGVQLGLVTNGEQWMLVNAPKGETSAFVSWYASLWLEEPLTLRAFTSLLGAARFFSVADEDTLVGMLKESVNEQQEVTNQLGYQVRRAVEVLIRAIDRADQDRGRSLLKDIRESDLYEAALTVMMRLVFLFSAEERGLLLLGDLVYDQNYAVSTLRAQLRETADQQGEEVLERRFDAWCRLLATFRAVHDGIHHDRLNLPAYGGSLFDPERYPFLEGRTALIPSPSPEMRRESTLPLGEGKGEGPLPISNRTVLHLLEALQILRVKVPGGGPAEPRRLSFRSLDVEQIGHVYEGLLDHIAVRAKEPVLGLAGTRDKEPELTLSDLQAQQSKGEKPFLTWLKEQTGHSENALRKAMQEKPDVFGMQQLQIACNNDAAMFGQVSPYAGLVRLDDFGYPSVFSPGSVYVTAGATRRATGTHYTPRSLTEPIVQHTLEPLVYTGPAEGLAKVEWKLKSPAELLDLKVCDMAMGSAGFLVQVIRYLSERLVEAWDQISLSLPGRGQGEGAGRVFRITPEGQPATGKPGELIIPTDDEERLVLARRLVADRCVYGVDKNPLAVEIAKLSIWLTTMDKGRPFTFLDHALKCGDSLVGADEDMYRKWAFSLKGAQFTLYLTQLEELVAAARQKRKELESFTVLDVRDAEHKAALLKEADVAMARVKLGCDLLVGVRLLGLKKNEQEQLLEHLLWDYAAGEPMDGYDAQRALNAARKEHAFHWPFEFPEVYENGGFNAFVGNPPFMRGKSISTNFGEKYFSYLHRSLVLSKGSADFCVHFLLGAFKNIRLHGTLGLITTNTISQSDTREAGLDRICENDGYIYRAEKNKVWPGTAAVTVSIIHMIKGKNKILCLLDDHYVVFITSLLDDHSIYGNPYQLHENSNISHMGSIILSMGFTLSTELTTELISKATKNKDVIFPYLRGEDFTSSPTQSPRDYVINFFDWPLEKAKEYPDCFRIICEKVYPERQTKKGSYKTKWWQYGRRQEQLYEAAKSQNRILFHAFTSKHVCFSFVPTNYIYAGPNVAFILSEYSAFAILQSSFHVSWAWTYCSTMRNAGITYAATDAFLTFPFPKIATDDPFAKNLLIECGEKYFKFRENLMIENNYGLTDLYNNQNNNKVKSRDLENLRKYYVEMDNAVATAYGWSDLDLGHGFHETAQGVRFTISEPARREVLARLLKLNHERYEEEVNAGLHEGKKGKKTPPLLDDVALKRISKPRSKARKAVPKAQLNWLSEPEPVEPAEVAEPTANAEPARADQIGSWDQVVCLGCGKHLVEFAVEEHTQKVHKGEDPGYRKMGG